MSSDERLPDEVRNVEASLRDLASNGTDACTGHKIGKYSVLRLLSCSGQAIVLLAHDPDLDRQVVLKVYPPIDPEHEQKLLSEGRALARVKSPHVARCLSTERVDGQIFLIVEYVEGETLATRLESGPLSVSETKAIIGDIASGLAEVHEHGLVHSDLKPANVILGPANHAKLIDFGLARDLSENNHMTAGTAAYMPPEIANGKSQQIGLQSDVFGLGAILFHLMTGTPPFSAPTSQKALKLAQAGEVPLDRLVGAPAGLRSLVTDCLRREPSSRPASAKEILRRLEQLQERKTSQRRRWLSAGAILATCMLIILGIFIFGRAPRDHPRARMLRLAQQGEYGAALEVGKKATPQSPSIFDAYMSEVRNAQVAEAIPKYGLAAQHLAAARRIAKKAGWDSIVRTLELRERELTEREESRGPDYSLFTRARRDFCKCGLALHMASACPEPFRDSMAKTISAVYHDHKNLFGTDHLRTVIAGYRRVWWLRSESRAEFRRMLRYTEESRVSFEKLLGPNAHETLEAQSRLGLLQVHSGDVACGMKVLHDARDRARDHLGPDLRCAWLTARRLAQGYRITGDTDSSYAQISEASQSVEHFPYLGRTLLFDRAETALAAGEAEQAKKYLAQAAKLTPSPGDERTQESLLQEADPKKKKRLTLNDPW